MTSVQSPAMQRIVDALREHGCDIKEGTPTTKAQCPAHQDDKPSLGISERKDGRGVVIHCYAGCSYKDILTELNLRESDLFDDSEVANSLNPRNSYRYSSGREKHRKLEADGSKNFFWTGSGKDDSLYAVNCLGDAKIVYLCEGEKAVDFLRANGHTAVATGGASRTDVDFEPLKGRHIMMIVDRDSAGLTWAQKCAKKLKPIAASINPMQAKVEIPSADIVEHILAGHSLGELLPVTLPSTNGATPHEEPQGREIRWLRGTDVETAVPVWGWNFRGKGRIQLGTMALFAGRPGAGKSSAARWFAAQASLGELEGHWEGKPQHVAYIAAEESLKYTIGPGLRASGADMSRIHFPSAYNAGEPTQILSALDEIRLTEYMIDHKITIVIVDPLMSTVTAATDINRNNEVRGQIAPWGRIADTINGITLGVVHLRKGSSNGDVVAAINGSSAFGELARSIFAFAKSPDSEERVMSQHKNSTGSEDLALLYDIRGRELMADDGKIADIGIFFPLGDSEFTVEDIMSEGMRSVNGGALHECMLWLKDYLSVEQPALSSEVKREAAKAGGWGHATIERAANKLKVLCKSSGFPRVTTWELPGSPVASQSPQQNV
jgi:hypothetical protein